MTDLPPPEFERLSRTQILVAMAVTAIVLLVVAKLWLRLGSVELLPLVWNAESLLLGAGLSASITLASSLLYRVWGSYRESAQFYLDMAIAPLAWFDLVWLGLLPGMSEELLFRGVMLPALGLNPVGLVVSSLCFGVLHLTSAKHWAYVAWATVVGSILGASVLWTGNLLVPMVAHVLTNWMSGLMWKWRERRSSL